MSLATTGRGELNHTKKYIDTEEQKRGVRGSAAKGAANKTREGVLNDQYFTSPAVLELMYPFIDKEKVIYEPFFGDGDSGITLRRMGFKVIHEPIDFFDNTHLGDVIISNPPFNDPQWMLQVLKDTKNTHTNNTWFILYNIFF